MALWQSTKKAGSKLFDLRVDKWLGLEYLKSTTRRTKYLIKDLMIPKKATRSESFEDALDRLVLTETDIQARTKEFTRLFYTFITLACGMILYALYLLIKGSAVISLICFCISIYLLSYSFHFHFWLFQLKNRKLGCTLREWFNSELSSEHQ